MLQALKGVFSADLSRSVITTAICSGVMYRMYASWNAPCALKIKRIESIPTFPALNWPPPRRFPNMATLFNEGDFKPSMNDPKEHENRALRSEKLHFLQNWIENQLPMTFTRGLFNTVDMFGPDTVLEFERYGAPPLLLRGPAQANLAFAVFRTYFALISKSRRIELLGACVDDENWCVEAHFRIVLLSSPSREDRTLPPNKLVKVLESKAIWIDFRAYFYLNRTGDLKHVRITRMNRQQRLEFAWSFSKTRMRDRFLPEQGLFTPAPPLIVFAKGLDEIDFQLRLILSELESRFEDGSNVDLQFDEEKFQDYVFYILNAAEMRKKASMKQESSSPTHPVQIPFRNACFIILGLSSLCTQSVA
ncbi:hypothetical protein Aperf_G00000034351 [Anoplocephala perfoliata]